MPNKMRILLFTLFVFAVSNALACSVGQETEAGYENVSVAHAYQHWLQGKKTKIPFVFLDVRTIQEFKAEHTLGAIHIPVSELSVRIHEVPKGKQVYVYCEAGVRATKASAILAKAYSVENLPESMHGWRDAGYPVEK